MSVIAELFSPDVNASAGPFDDFWYMPIGAETESGEKISADSAMQISAVYACVRVLAETIASLPLFIYKRDGDNKEIARDHQLYSLLHSQPNKKQTSFTWREMMTGHVCLRGNAYNFIDYDNRGRVRAIVPLHPDRVEPKKFADGSIIYECRNDRAEIVRYLPEEILHIPGLCFNGVKGIDPIRYMAQTMGISLATQKFGARFFKNGISPVGLLKHPKTITKPAADRLRQQLQEKIGGKNQHSPLIAEEGLEWQNIGFEPDKAQFLETRKFQINEIARIFRVPLHLIQEHEKSTSWGKGIEQINIAFVVHTIRPWLVRIEQAINTKLLDADGDYFAEFKIDGLLRGDMKARFEVYQIGINCGIFSPNDVLKLENMNTYDGGNVHYRPLNMTTTNENARMAELEEQAKTDPAAAEELANMKFKQELVKAFLADKTTNDVMFNMTNVMELLHEAGVISNPKYKEPWLPVVTTDGPVVTGETKKDSEGDIVGGEKAPPDPAEAGGQGTQNTSRKTQNNDAASALITDAAGRIANCEIKGLERRVRFAAGGGGDRDKFNQWIEGFYRNNAGYIDRTLVAIADDTKQIVDAIICDGHKQITTVKDVEELLSQWRQSRSAQIEEIITQNIKGLNK